MSSGLDWFPFVSERAFDLAFSEKTGRRKTTLINRSLTAGEESAASSARVSDAEKSADPRADRAMDRYAVGEDAAFAEGHDAVANRLSVLGPKDARY